MAKNKKSTNLTQIIQDLKDQTEKSGPLERMEDPTTERENKYYEVNASTVSNLFGALEELRALVGKG